MRGPLRRGRHPGGLSGPGPADGTDGNATGTGCAQAVVPAGPAGPASLASRVLGALSGFREPVVLILLAIAFFTSISGKPVDGVLMLIVATGLAWDAGRRGRGTEHDGAPQAADTLASRPAHASARRRLLVIAALVISGAAYAGVMGSFIRYSWPATAGIILLGTVVVLIGWHGPLRNRPIRGRLPVAGTIAWVVVLFAGGLWELSALLLQPSITTDSYAHPTISTLTDPVLSTAPGRSLIIAAWLALGWYLVER
jgi:hypothetical protein